MSYSNVGKVWTPGTLRETLSKMKKPKWCRAVTLHHTASPTLAQRPDGWKVQHMRNLQSFYQGKLGWSRGPHFFTDEDEIYGLSPFTTRGVHAVSFNSYSIGIEVLGDYDRESPLSGRGLKCWKLAAQTTAVLLDWMGQKPNTKTVLFHRDDPKTSKTCPGTKVDKARVISMIKGLDDDDIKIIAKPKGDKDENKPRIPGWNRYQRIDGKWFVPVLDFLDHIGGDRDTIISQMESKSGKFYYDGDLIEGAFYDKTKKTTMAPALELMNFS